MFRSTLAHLVMEQLLELCQLVVLHCFWSSANASLLILIRRWKGEPEKLGREKLPHLSCTQYIKKQNKIRQKQSALHSIPRMFQQVTLLVYKIATSIIPAPLPI